MNRAESTSSASPARNNALRPRLVTVLVVVLFAAIALPITIDVGYSPYAWDESEYHLPTVHAISAHWPALDLVNDCKSAIAPGLHYLLATVAQVTSADRLPMRLTNLVLSFFGLFYLGRKLNSLPPLTAGAALACLAGSSFFLKSAAFIYTDNAALIAVAFSLIWLLDDSIPPRLAAASLGASASIFIRQNNAWLVLPLAWKSLQQVKREDTRKVQTALKLIPALLPAFTLAWLVVSWRGLVPPAWHDEHYVAGVITPAGLIYSLSLLAIYAGPFLWAAGWWPRVWNEIPRATWWWSAATLVLVLVTPLSASEIDGRWGGYLWMLAERSLPTPAHFLIFAILAPLGTISVGILTNSLLKSRHKAIAVIWLLAYVSWLIASLPNRQIFQRYFEPPTLLFLLLWLIHISPRQSHSKNLGLVLLAAFQFMLSAVVLYRA